LTFINILKVKDDNSTYCTFSLRVLFPGGLVSQSFAGHDQGQAHGRLFHLPPAKSISHPQHQTQMHIYYNAIIIL